MKRRQVLGRIVAAATRQGKRWELVRQGGDHEIWRCGSTEVPVPRHAEIGEQVARAIWRELEDELGKGWWR
jgi:hypothetical protein